MFYLIICLYLSKKVLLNIDLSSIVDDIMSETGLVLANTIYFRAAWEKPFTTKKTRGSDFYVNDLLTIKVPTMYTDEYFKCGPLADLNSNWIELPFQVKQNKRN